jgi:hypothetical protein
MQKMSVDSLPSIVPQAQWVSASSSSLRSSVEVASLVSDAPSLEPVSELWQGHRSRLDVIHLHDPKPPLPSRCGYDSFGNVVPHILLALRTVMARFAVYDTRQARRRRRKKTHRQRHLGLCGYMRWSRRSIAFTEAAPPLNAQECRGGSTDVCICGPLLAMYMGYATLVLCCVLVCVRLRASGELLLIYLARMPLNDSHNTSTHVPTVTETCILKGDDKMSNDDHQRFVVQELKSAQRVEIRNLIKAHSHFLYDPTQMVVDKCSSWYGSYTPKTSDGYLDHIPEGLAGCISLSAFLLAPATCPIGRAARLVCDPDSLRFFLKEDPLSVSYCSSATHHVRFVSELLASNVCRKDRTRARGYAKFFTVVKKVDDRGIPVLRTILDCRSANEFFRQPDPVNLASLAEILAAFANVESMRTLDLRHMFHQIRLHPHLHDYFVVAFGSLRLKWQVLPMGWTWACFIAQSISTFFVAGEMAYSWSEIPRVITLGRCQFFVVYDNIIGGGPTEELDLLWNVNNVQKKVDMFNY